MRAGVGEIVQGEGGDLGSSQGLGLGDFSLLGCVCKSQGAWNPDSGEERTSGWGALIVQEAPWESRREGLGLLC